MVDGQPYDDRFGVGPLASDANLLLGEQLIGNRVGVVLAQQLALLLFEFGQHAVAPLDLLAAGPREIGEALADASELHWTYLSGIERGRNNPPWTKLAGLATGLGITISDIARAAEAEAANPDREPPEA